MATHLRILLFALTSIFVWPSLALAERPEVLVNPHVQGNGTPKGIDIVETIQEGIDMVDSGGRVLVLPLAIQSWSLTSLQQRVFKTGGRLIRHARYFILQLAESHLTSTLFRQILGRIARLGWHPT